MHKIGNILIHPAFLALVISLLIIWVLPTVFNKYEAELIEKQYSDNDFPNKYFYHDFDHDGNSEMVRQGLNSGTLNPYFCIDSNDGITMGQWNFGGTWIKSALLFFGDYDNNGFDEVYGFTWENDSVFINGIEPIGRNTDHLITEFLFKCPLNNKQIPCGILTGKLTDLDGDSFKEVVFSVNAGFNLQPRAIFAYDVKRDSVYRSPFMGASNQKIHFVNLDSDPYDEILIDVSAHRNYGTPVPYSDSIAWLIALDNDLSFLFEPVSLNPRFVISSNHAIIKDKEILILNINKKAGKTSKDIKASLFSPQGKLISQSNQPEFVEGIIFNKTRNNLTEKLYITFKGDIFEFDSEFKFKKVRNLKIKLKKHHIKLIWEIIPYRSLFLV